MTRRSATLLLGLTASVFGARPLHGQTGPLVDSVSRGRASDPREAALAEVRDARLRLGPVRFRPFVRLRNLTYVNQSFFEDARGDLTAGAEAGVRAIVPFGRSVFLRSDVGASYTWFARNADQRRVAATPSLSLQAFVGRATISVEAQRDQFTSSLSSEEDRTITQRVDTVRGTVQYDVGARVFVFAGGGLQRPRYITEGLLPQDAERIAGLDRTETFDNVGVGYSFSPRTRMSVGYVETRSRFRLEPLRDGGSKGFVIGAAYDRTRFFVNLQGGVRNYEPEAPGAFPAQRDLFGASFVSYHLRRFDAQFFGSRRRIDSIFTANAAFLETRGGVGASIPLGTRGLATLGAFFEGGTNSYSVAVETAVGPVTRRDDVLAVRGNLALHLLRNVSLSVDVSETRYDSNIEAFDRDVFRITTNLSFSIQLLGR